MLHMILIIHEMLRKTRQGNTTQLAQSSYFSISCLRWDSNMITCVCAEGMGGSHHSPNEASDIYLNFVHK